MKSNKTTKMVISALFAAMIFVGTQFIKVPLPFGYFNFGDCFVILSALIISNPYAMTASAVGSMLADALSGYTVYVPATLIIKCIMVVIVTAISKLGNNKTKALNTVFLIAGIVCSELVMICGYFLYDILLYGITGAVASLSGNIMQGVVAIITSMFILTVFEKSGLMKYIKTK